MPPQLGAKALMDWHVDQLDAVLTEIESKVRKMRSRRPVALAAG